MWVTTNFYYYIIMLLLTLLKSFWCYFTHIIKGQGETSKTERRVKMFINWLYNCRVLNLPKGAGLSNRLSYLYVFIYHCVDSSICSDGVFYFNINVSVDVSEKWRVWYRYYFMKTTICQSVRIPVKVCIWSATCI